MKQKDTFFDLNLTIIKWAGMWIPEKNSSLRTKLWYLFYNTFWISYVCIFYTPSEFISFSYTYRNVTWLMKNVSVAMTHLLASIKVAIWLIRRKELLGIIKTLQEKASDYEGTDDFHPDIIIREEQRTKSFVTIAFLVCGASVSIAALVAAFITLFTDYEQYWKVEYGSGNQTTFTYNQPLPYFSWVPFDYRSSRLRFSIVIFYGCIPAFVFAWIIIGFDTLFTTLISYVTAHFRILQGAFRTIRVRCLRRLKMENDFVLHDPLQLEAAMSEEMKHCIKHLQILFDICETLEAIFTYLILGQVLISSVVICACLYVVSFVPITSKFFATELFYLMGITMQIFLYCYFGSRVTLTAQDISLALVEGDWLSASKSFKKNMLITMTRMRKPLVFSMGKFAPLTLPAFVSIGRGAYSFFAVIKKKNTLEP